MTKRDLILLPHMILRLYFMGTNHICITSEANRECPVGSVSFIKQISFEGDLGLLHINMAYKKQLVGSLWVFPIGLVIILLADSVNLPISFLILQGKSKLSLLVSLVTQRSQ